MSDTIEYIDLYDENRLLTGEVVKRDTFLQPGQFQIYALAVIKDLAGRFLITQRSANKSWGAGMWEIVGGGVSAGDNSEDTIIREIGEEVGLTAAPEQLELLLTYKNVDPVRGHNYFTDIWQVTLDFAPEEVVLATRESTGFQLATWEDIETLGEAGQFLHFSRLKEALGK